MSTKKLDSLIIGKGSALSNGTSTEFFVSTVPLATWNSGTTYGVDACAEYAGSIYRSLVGSNTGNTPSSNPSDWEILIETAQDGMVAVIVAGANSGLDVRGGGEWGSLSNQPLSTTLGNNQSAALAFRIPYASQHSATIEYTITRGTNYQKGTLRYAANGNIGESGVQLSAYDIVDIGPGNVNVLFDADIDGTGNYVEIRYNSDNSGPTGTMTYTIVGWN